MNKRFKRILRQLGKDIWGKDANRGVTLSYSWLANQFGHLALGAIVALISYAVFEIWYKDQETKEFLGLLSSVCFWLILEVIMFTDTLKKWKQTESYPFKPNLRFLILDLLTDLGYFQLGAVIFYLPHHLDQAIVWYVFCTIIGLLSMAFIYWYDIRIHQQEAHLPFSFHLARWKGRMNSETVEEIEKFVEGKSSIQHILLFGEIKSEKSAFAIAVGNEMVNRKKKTYYVTINEFLRLLYEGKSALKDYRDGNDIWDWTECEVIVIDHINPGNPVPLDLLSAVDLEKHILNDSFGSRNIAALILQKVIWSVGDLYEETESQKVKQSWKKMLLNLGVPDSEILILELI